MQPNTDFPASPATRQLAPARVTQRVRRSRRRVTLRGVVAVAGAWLLLLVTVLVGAGSLALIPPLAPVFAVFILGGAGLATSALEYARRSSK